MEIILTAAERVRLRTAMKQAASARLYRRLQAVFLAGEGHSATQVATITGSSVRSVQCWCSTWRCSGQRRQPQKLWPRSRAWGVIAGCPPWTGYGC